MSVNEQRVDLGDIEISYLEAGPRTRPLVMVHGFTGHRLDFVDQASILGADRWVVAPDLRGHGDSTHTGRAETFGFEQMVADLLAFLDALEIERCDLLGHSFGGMIALRFVLEHPGRVASLVCMNTAPFAPSGYGREVFLKAGALARNVGMQEFQRIAEKAGRKSTEVRPSDRQTLKWEARYWDHHRLRIGAMDPVAYEPLGLEMMDQATLVGRLGEIRCPTTVIVGSEDESFLAGADALAQGIPGAARVTLDAGHHSHMESPEGWLDAMRAHLDRAG